MAKRNGSGVLGPAAPRFPACAGRTTARVPAKGMRLGRYRLIEPLGRGCQGQVWRALQIEPIVAEVALKLLTPEQACQPGWRSQFRREAEWGARLSNPGLLPTYELGADDGLLFLTMPLVEGNCLAEVIARRHGCQGGFPKHSSRRHHLDRLGDQAFRRAMVAAAARVARAAAAAHAARVVHRDIKPANILIGRMRPEEVYLCDFGLGRDLDDHTHAPLPDSAGTPLYMAPERLLCQTADEVPGDIYSLGATLAEAVTLTPPFSVPDELPPDRWSEYLAQSAPLRPRDLVPSIPRSLEAAILRAMSRDPHDRHSSMAAFADDLERLHRDA